jgi:uncharacterized protein (DUF302 family)
MTGIEISIEHVVVGSDRSFEQVVQTLEAQLGPKRDPDRLLQDLKTTNPGWEQVRHNLEQPFGPSGLELMDKFDLGFLITLKGEPTRAVQYVIGNPLLAIEMAEHAPEVALYAPFRLAVYEDRAGKTFVAYDRFASQLAQYANPEIARVAQLVGEKQDALVSRATGREGGPHHD